MAARTKARKRALDLIYASEMRNRSAIEALKFANAPDQLPYFGPPVTIPPDPNDPNGPTTFDGKVHLSQGDTPATRTASVHVNGLDLVGSIASDGSNVGKNASSLAAVGQGHGRLVETPDEIASAVGEDTAVLMARPLEAGPS